MGTELSDLLNLAADQAQIYAKDLRNKGFGFGRLWDFIKEVVRIVEALSNQFNKEVAESQIKGESKQDFALRLINANVDIPFVPEWVEQIVFKMIIDKAVKGFNSSGVFKNA